MREKIIYLDREEQDTVFYDSKPFIKIYLYKGIIQNITTAMLVALLHLYKILFDYWNIFFIQSVYTKVGYTSMKMMAIIR